MTILGLHMVGHSFSEAGGGGGAAVAVKVGKYIGPIQPAVEFVGGKDG